MKLEGNRARRGRGGDQKTANERGRSGKKLISREFFNRDD